MKIIIHVATFFAFFMWFLMMMTSPMLFAAPSSEPTDWKLLAIVVVIMLIPVAIAGGYMYFDWKFLGLPPKIFLIICAVISLVFGTMLGFPNLFKLAIQGIPRSGVFTTEKEVYLNGKVISGADPKTFTVLTKSSLPYYFKDKASVYYYENRLLEADPKTFHAALAGAVYDVYWLDDKHVYASGVLIPEADAKTFEALGEGSYGRDAKHVFFRGKIVEGADPQSFVIVAHEDDGSPIDSKDKVRSYKSGKARP